MDKKKKRKKQYEILVPDPYRPGEWDFVDGPMSKKKALAYVQEHYGADEKGRVSLLNQLPIEEGEDDDE